MPTKIPDRIDLTQAEAQFGVIPDSRRSRPLFFDGKFLTADDLKREQAYLLTRQADLARSLGFGVVSGLRVKHSDTTASNLGHAAASLHVSAGHGLTPAGEPVLLPADLVVDLSNVPRLENLNASFGLEQKPNAPLFNLSGLFVVGLRAVEFTANPTPVFPASLQGTYSSQDGEIIEATAVTLVPYPGAAQSANPAAARSRAAREIFLEQQPPKLPAGVLPLAMIYLRGGFLQWVDEFLVRREAGDDDRFGFGFAPRALAEAHFYHYRAMLDEVPVAARDGRLAAADFFEVLPPGGPLPVGTVDARAFTQAYFPAEARVELTLVPEDELAGLMDESIDQPPIDLRLKPEDNDALAILVLAPVPRARYQDAVRQLTVLRPVLRHAAPSLLGQQRPLQALQRLNSALQLRTVNGAIVATPETEAALADAAWAKVLGQTPQLWYVRRRNLPYASDLASQALPADTLPAILVQPKTTPAKVGDDVTFQVVAVGSAPLTYQWCMDGADLPGQTDSRLTLKNVQTKDAGSYTVMITNAVGTTTSDAVTFTFSQAPAITTQPQDVTAPVGATAIFKVAATGTAPLTFQWRKDGADLPGSTGISLALDNVQTTSKGRYDVVVSNTAGTATSNKATLSVEQPAAPRAPVISLPPRDVTTAVGTTANFSVSVAGTAPFQYQWRKDGVNLPGDTDASLTLANVAAKSAGAYDVVVTNAVGSITSPAAALTVQGPPAVLPPAITGQPQEVTAPVGTSVNFIASVSGTAPLDFQWRRDGVEVQNARGASLTLLNVQPDAQGAYDLVVRNPAGSVTSVPAKLTVEVQPPADPPVITTQPAGVTAPAGTTATFRVALTGTAPFKFQWRKDGTVIQGASEPALTLRNVQASQGGAYDVVVINGPGMATSTKASLTVLNAPAITAQPQDVATTVSLAANFTVAATGTAPLTFQWRKDGADLPGANAASLALGNLLANQAGAYSVLITNAAGAVTSRTATLAVGPYVDPCSVQQTAVDSFNLQLITLNSQMAAMPPQFRGAIMSQIAAVNASLAAAQAALNTCRLQNPGSHHA